MPQAGIVEEKAEVVALAQVLEVGPLLGIGHVGVGLESERRGRLKQRDWLKRLNKHV